MKNKGFTLIELLVVVAIIGILSTIVVINVERARREARNASIQANLAAARVEAEFIFRNGNSYLTPGTGLCATAGGTLSTTTPGLIRIRDAIDAQTEANVSITCHATATSFCVQVPLVGDDAGYACIDHLGFSGVLTTTTCTGLVRCK